MPVTPVYQLPTPEQGDTPNIPAHLRMLAEAADTAITPVLARASGGHLLAEAAQWTPPDPNATIPFTTLISAQDARLMPDGTLRITRPGLWYVACSVLFNIGKDNIAVYGFDCSLFPAQAGHGLYGAGQIHTALAVAAGLTVITKQPAPILLTPVFVAGFAGIRIAYARVAAVRITQEDASA
jgi:hypothetical protein